MKKHLILMLSLMLAFGSSTYAQRDGRNRGNDHGNDRHYESAHRGNHKIKKSTHKGRHHRADRHYDHHNHRPVRNVSSRHRDGYRNHSIAYAPHRHYDYHYDMHGRHYRYHNGYFYVRHRGHFERTIPPIGFRLDFAPLASRHIIFAGRDYFVDGELVFLFNPYYGFYERVYPPRGFWMSCG